MMIQCVGAQFGWQNKLNQSTIQIILLIYETIF